jgi:hypothetical protein
MKLIYFSVKHLQDERNKKEYILLLLANLAIINFTAFPTDAGSLWEG